MRVRAKGLCLGLIVFVSGWAAASASAGLVLFQDGFEGRTPGTTLDSQAPPVGDHYGTGGTAANSSTNPPGFAATGSIFASAGLGNGNRWFVSPATPQSAITGQAVRFNVNFYIVTDSNTGKAIDF